MSDRYELEAGVHEDKTVPFIVYGLYLLGLFNGLTILVGLIVAYAHRGRSGPVMHTHYTLLIRTVWIALGWVILGSILGVVGFILSLTVILLIVGGPMLLAAYVIFALGWIWLLLRMIVGIIYLSRGEEHPRPTTWFF